MEKLMIISADNHASAPLEDYRPFLEKKYHADLDELHNEEKELLAIFGPFSSFPDEALELIDGDHAIRSGGASRCWDTARRIQEMDREGVAAEIVHAGTQSGTMPFFSQVNKRHPAELRAVGARAYHRWFAERMAESGHRIHGVGDPGPCHDMEATVRELHWMADHGFVAVGPPGIIKDTTLPPLSDRHFDPFWAACEERQLVISVHAGYGTPQGSFFDFAAKVAADSKHAEGLKEKGAIQNLITKLRESRESPFYLDIRPRRAFWQMVLGGVFDRFPKLRLVFAEVRADWIPGTLAYLDQRLRDEGHQTRLTASEYFARNCFATPSSPRPSEIALRHKLGLERIMFGVDYPHPEGTWPNTHEWLRLLLSDVPLVEVRDFLGENAVRCYNLDRSRLLEIAAKVGPDPAQLFKSQKPVDSRIIDHFQTRAGFNDNAEAVDTELLDIAVGEDLMAARGAA